MKSKEYMNEQVTKIRIKVEDHQLSFIIGAGFSKNVSSKFLDWKQLLNDMIIEMYEPKLSINSKQNNTHRKQPVCHGIYPKRLNSEQIDQIISRIGYLGIASEYIRRKGYREAIDVYMEQRLPYLSSEDGKLVVKCNDKVVDKNPNIEIHKKLIEIDVDNIYTFNYDNLLEEIAKSNIVTNSLKEEKRLEEENLKISRLKNDYNSYCESYKDDTIKKETVLETYHLVKKDGVFLKEVDSIIKDIYPDWESLSNLTENQVTDKRNKTIEKLDKIISRNNDKISLEEQKRIDKYNVIKNSGDISLSKKYKSIFKLHGDLRTSQTQEYGFDGDIHKHYVITQEDYDTYPLKHEAFVNLMRIALLRESFCLIGFSGDDPNFLNWLSWVRNVLDKRDKSKKKQTKIFFIDVEINDLSPEKTLLFKNNDIEYINLDKIYKKKSRSENLKSFFSDLSKQDCKYYENALEKIKIEPNYDNKTNTISLTINVESANDLWNSLLYNRIPTIGGGQSYSRENVISRTPILIKNKQINDSVAKVIYAAISGEMMPLDTILSSIEKDGYNELNEFYTQIENFPEPYKKFKLLEQRSKLLTNQEIYIVTDNKDERNYNLILCSAFNFDFIEMKKKLADWNPNEKRWILVKLGLNSIFEQNKNIEDESSFERKDFVCDQEYLYALEIKIRLLWINGFIHDSNNRKNKELLLQKNNKLNQIWNNIDYLTKEINKPLKTDIKPYGNLGHSFFLGRRDTKLIASVQLLQTWIEIGLPLSNGFSILIDKENWYKVFKNLYERYPYPCLYFSLHYGDNKDLLKRVAQDYIYSNSLSDQTSDLLEKLFSAFEMEETPKSLKQAILIVLPYFMKCVKAIFWKNRFMDIFRKTNIIIKDYSVTRLDNIYAFLIDGIELITDKATISEILVRSLSNFESITDYENSLIIAAIYNKKSFEFTDKILDIISKKIPNASNRVQYYILLNLNRFLTAEQKQLCNNQFSCISEEELKDENLLEGICSIADKSVELERKLKIAILNSPKLWATGKINDGEKISYGFPIERININNIQDGLKFTINEIKEMYNKMICSFDEIKEKIEERIRNNSPRDFLNWKDLLIMMRLYLRRNKPILKEVQGFEIIEKRVDLNYCYEVGCNSIIESLLSDEEQTISDGIEWLYYDVKSFGVEKFKTEYIIIANAIISNNPLKLNRYFNHFVWMISEHTAKFDKETFKPLLDVILKLYRPYYDSDINKNWDLTAKKEEIENELIKINVVLSSWGGVNEFWTNYEKRYYSI